MVYVLHVIKQLSLNLLFYLKCLPLKDTPEVIYVYFFTLTVETQIAKTTQSVEDTATALKDISMDSQSPSVNSAWIRQQGPTMFFTSK